MKRKPEDPEKVRNRQAAMASRKRQQGLTKVSVWVPLSRASELKEYAKGLMK